METTESDIGYPEEQPPAVDDTPAEGTPQREGAGDQRQSRDNDDGKATGNPQRRLAAVARRACSDQQREIVAWRRAIAERARDEAVDQSTRPSQRRGSDRRGELLKAPHAMWAPALRSARRCRARACHPASARCRGPAIPGRAAARAACRAPRRPPRSRRRAGCTGSGCPPQATVTRNGLQVRSRCTHAIVQNRPPAAS